MAQQTGAEYRSMGLSKWSQFCGDALLQPGHTHSLREIKGELKNYAGKLVHLGMTASARSSLSYTNAHRSWKLFEQVF